MVGDLVPVQKWGMGVMAGRRRVENEEETEEPH